MLDVVVIGAGIAGLTCARQLQQAGYRVVVVEKSRGVGGRSATRRLEGTFADHGLRYLQAQGEHSQRLIEVMQRHNLLTIWFDQAYIAPAGMNRVGKFLARDLEIRFNQRVVAIALLPNQTWQIQFEASHSSLQAKALVVAIPAPQALILLEPLKERIPEKAIAALRSVHFDPCLTVIAGYPREKQAELNSLPWKSQTLSNHPELAWIGLDSSKHPHPQQPVFVLHSSPILAQQHFDDEDVQPVGYSMLAAAAKLLIPWLDRPTFMQVHRWRYAFPKQSLSLDYLSCEPLKLLCCGDWCGGNLVESALQSGLAAGDALIHSLKQS